MSRSDILGDVEGLKSIISKMGKSILKPGGHGYQEYGPIELGTLIKNTIGNYADVDEPVAITLLEVVLSARANYEKIVVPRMKYIRSLSIPRDNSLGWLYNEVSSFEGFYKLCKISSQNKYNTIVALIKAYPLLKDLYGGTTEYETFHNWAISTNVSNKTTDIVGQIPRIGIATFQHLRMNFGANTIKPDQRVCEVLEREFGYGKVSQVDAVEIVETIADIVGLPALYLDQLFVKYGSGEYKI